MMDYWVCNIVASVMDYGHVYSVVLRYHSLAVAHFACTENGYEISICATKYEKCTAMVYSGTVYIQQLLASANVVLGAVKIFGDEILVAEI